MSTEIGITGIYDLKDMLADWQAEHQADVELNIELDVELSDDGSFATVFAPGLSIRGFSVRNDDAPYVRLSSLASRGDWRLAYSFLRFALDRSAEPELAPEELTDEASQARGAEEFRSGARLLQHVLHERGNEYTGLPVLHFTLNVDRNDLPAGDLDVDTLELDLIARAERYAHARVPSVFTLGDSTTAVVWSGEALLTSAVDHVILGDENVVIDWPSFIAAYPVETLKGTEPLFYFPATDDTASLSSIGKPLSTLGR
jgi:hypothetical protein